MKGLLLALVILTPLAAHPPGSIDFNYDTETGILTVKVIHSVKDASKHYINKVEIELNGTQLIEQKFRSQLDEENQEALYKVIDAKAGDKFTVEAYCNISGKKKTEFEVTQPKSSEGQQ